MAKSNKGFLFFYDWLEVLRELDSKNFKKIVLAMIDYQQNGTLPPKFSGTTEVIAKLIFPQIDRRIASAKAGKMGMEARYGKQSEENVTGDTDDSVSNGVNNGATNNVSNHRQDKRQDKDKDYRQDKDKGDALITLPFSDGVFAVSSVLAEKYKKDYPNIDVISVLNDISDWLNKNSQTKPMREAHQFICGWLKGENERARSATPGTGTERSYDADEFFKAALEKSKRDGFWK